MTGFRTLDDIEVAGRRVLVRVDLNVPMREGAVGDATRIDRVAPTLRELAGRGARVIVASHFGRPKGKRVPAMSLKPLAAPLARALGGLPVRFSPDCIGAEVEAAVANLAPGGVALLENLRFHTGEEANDPAFADALAGLADLYVNDAFSAAHRAHASTAAVAERLPNAAGRLMQAELEALGKALQAPERPVTAIVGGAKVSTKLALLANLIERVDRLVIGGAMANTFLHAQGVAIGASLHEPDLAADARRIVAEASGAGCEIVLPTDVVVTREFREGAEGAVTRAADVPANGMILDLGPETCTRIETSLATSRTLVWNGPLGAFEIAPFDRATTGCARAAARLTGEGSLLSVAGGGDTVAALQGAGVLGAFSYVSTAGGAFLEWLEGRTLPGVAALETGSIR
ncbi:MAG: phosphoglycerate kinase [Rhodospirillaceae bacterium]|nr:phosphoglycerate kinase [Rhodospirillaceae bacterium]